MDVLFWKSLPDLQVQGNFNDRSKKSHERRTFPGPVEDLNDRMKEIAQSSTKSDGVGHYRLVQVILETSIRRLYPHCNQLMMSRRFQVGETTRRPTNGSRNDPLPGPCSRAMSRVSSSLNVGWQFSTLLGVVPDFRGKSGCLEGMARDIGKHRFRVGMTAVGVGVGVKYGSGMSRLFI